MSSLYPRLPNQWVKGTEMWEGIKSYSYVPYIRHGSKIASNFCAGVTEIAYEQRGKSVLWKADMIESQKSLKAF